MALYMFCTDVCTISYSYSLTIVVNSFATNLLTAYLTLMAITSSWICRIFGWKNFKFDKQLVVSYSSHFGGHWCAIIVQCLLAGMSEHHWSSNSYSSLTSVSGTCKMFSGMVIGDTTSRYDWVERYMAYFVSGNRKTLGGRWYVLARTLLGREIKVRQQRSLTSPKCLGVKQRIVRLQFTLGWNLT